MCKQNVNNLLDNPFEYLYVSWQFLWKAASPCNIQARSVEFFMQYTVHSMKRKITRVAVNIP